MRVFFVVISTRAFFVIQPVLLGLVFAISSSNLLLNVS